MQYSEKTFSSGPGQRPGPGEQARRAAWAGARAMRGAEFDGPRGGRRGPRGRGRGRGEGFGPGGFGPGGFGPGGPGGFGPGGRRGPGRGRRGDVRKAILAVLADGPANGYQIMSGIEERSNGLWRPSPGSVYPALNLLEDEGLIAPTTVEGKKAYELTEDGRTHLTEQGEPEPWDEVTQPHRGFLDVRAEAAALLTTLRQVAATGTEDQREKARLVLDRARRDLHRIMAGDEVSTDPQA